MLRSPAEIPATDEELACRAQQGCAASFEQLLRRFQTPVLHFPAAPGFGRRCRRPDPGDVSPGVSELYTAIDGGGRFRPGCSRSPAARASIIVGGGGRDDRNPSPSDELAGSTMENLDDLLASAAVVPQSAELAHDARLAAETLLRPLPVDLELLAGP